MEARELRIGNYVYDSTDHCRIDVKCSDFCYSENFEPIPLTEEWLIKMGFRKFIGKSGLFSYDIKETDFIVYQGRSGRWRIDFDGCTFVYVHQLQNLYFSLTNKELTIKND